MKYGLTDHQLNLILEVFKKNPEINEAKLFGSRSMGNFKSSSDVDVCLSGSSLSQAQVTRIAGILNNEISLPFQFDLLLDSASLDPSIRNHIEAHGLTIYKKHDPK